LFWRTWTVHIAHARDTHFLRSRRGVQARLTVIVSVGCSKNCTCPPYGQLALFPEETVSRTLINRRQFSQLSINRQSAMLSAPTFVYTRIKNEPNVSQRYTRYPLRYLDALDNSISERRINLIRFRSSFFINDRTRNSSRTCLRKTGNGRRVGFRVLRLTTSLYRLSDIVSIWYSARVRKKSNIRRNHQESNRNWDGGRSDVG